MMIVMRYALERYAWGRTGEPPISEFSGCLERLRNTNPNIELRFRCGICVAKHVKKQGSNHGKHRMPLENLLTHWTKRHKKGEDSWTRTLIELPTEAEVTEEVRNADQKLLMEKEALVQREEAMGNNVHIRPRLKGNLIMAAPLAQEAFDKLFFRRKKI
jgi:hypothetical protein